MPRRSHPGCHRRRHLPPSSLSHHHRHRHRHRRPNGSGEPQKQRHRRQSNRTFADGVVDSTASSSSRRCTKAFFGRHTSTAHTRSAIFVPLTVATRASAQPRPAHAATVCLPFSMAAVASSSVANSTKPKPRGLPSGFSVTTTSTSGPNGSNAALSRAHTSVSAQHHVEEAGRIAPQIGLGAAERQVAHNQTAARALLRLLRRLCCNGLGSRLRRTRA